MKVKDRKSSTREFAIFYSINAQHDNLGDLEIRKKVSDWIGDEVQAYTYTGKVPSDFIEGFELGTNFQCVGSAKEFCSILLRALISKRVVFIVPPGPRGFGGFRSNLRDLAMAALFILIRLMGGKTAMLGASVRVNGWGGKFFLRLLTRSLSLVALRDEQSVKLAQGNAKRFPDLAFEPKLNAPGNRKILSVVLRGDRVANWTFLETLHRVASEYGFDLQFVTQVGRDDTQHRELAAKLGVGCVPWVNDRRKQLELVSHAYEQSIAVVSDRLHGLILGLNGGAKPIGIIHNGVDKLTATFDGVFPLLAVDPENVAITEVRQAISSLTTFDVETEKAAARIQEEHQLLKNELLKLIR